MSDGYLEGLERQKARLEEDLQRLKREVATINKMIVKRQSEIDITGTGLSLNRKNEERAFYETLIIQILARSPNGLRTSEIFKEVTKEGYALNYNTLRTYVSQMRDKRAITRHPKYLYNWVPAKAACVPLNSPA